MLPKRYQDCAPLWLTKLPLADRYACPEHSSGPPELSKQISVELLDSHQRVMEIQGLIPQWHQCSGEPIVPHVGFAEETHGWGILVSSLKRQPAGSSQWGEHWPVQSHWLVESVMGKKWPPKHHGAASGLRVQLVSDAAETVEVPSSEASGTVKPPIPMQAGHQ